MVQLKLYKDSSLQQAVNLMDRYSAKSSFGVRCAARILVFSGLVVFRRSGVKTRHHMNQPNEIIFWDVLASKDYELNANSGTDVLYQ